MPVSKRLRYEVLRRDEHTCRYCGRRAPEVNLTIDHVVPTALGGSDEPDNLVAACSDCNAGKTSANPDAPLVADVQADALRWSRAMERAVQQRRDELADMEYAVAQFDDTWSRWLIGGDPVPRPASWRQSIEMFLQAGLSLTELEDLVDVTMTAPKVTSDQRFRYFCGCCWKEVRRRTDLAAEYVRQDEEDERFAGLPDFWRALPMLRSYMEVAPPETISFILPRDRHTEELFA